MKRFQCSHNIFKAEIFFSASLMNYPMKKKKHALEWFAMDLLAWFDAA